MNESHRISNYKVQVLQVHTLASFIEPKSKPKWQSRPGCGYFFVRTLHMLEMVRQDVHQFELQGLSTPILAEVCRADSTFFGGTIDSVEDRHAS
jgi:predicted transcriptional regulator